MTLDEIGVSFTWRPAQERAVPQCAGWLRSYRAWKTWRNAVVATGLKPHEVLCAGLTLVGYLVDDSNGLPKVEGNEEIWIDDIPGFFREHRVSHRPSAAPRRHPRERRWAWPPLQPRRLRRAAPSGLHRRLRRRGGPRLRPHGVGREDAGLPGRVPGRGRRSPSRRATSSRSPRGNRRDCHRRPSCGTPVAWWQPGGASTTARY